MVFLVRKGNPKHIKDWDDLTKPGVAVVIPNPKTSGNGRYSYLAAWGWRLQHGGNDAQAKDFVTKLFHNVPVLDTGGRGATTTFTAAGEIGDVLVTFGRRSRPDRSRSRCREIRSGLSDLQPVEREPPVALVDKVVDKRGTRKEAQAYLDFLFAPEGQEIIAKHYLRPRDPAVLKRYVPRSSRRSRSSFTVEQVFGSWDKSPSDSLRRWRHVRPDHRRRKTRRRLS